MPALSGHHGRVCALERLFATHSHIEVSASMKPGPRFSWPTMRVKDAIHSATAARSLSCLSLTNLVSAGHAAWRALDATDSKLRTPPVPRFCLTDQPVVIRRFSDTNSIDLLLLNRLL